MNNNITIHNCLDESMINYPYKSLVFSGGEPHVEVDLRYIKDQPIWVYARVYNSEDFMTLVLLLDAIKPHCKELSLFIPYFPGARQDRRQEGTAFSAQAYVNITKIFDLRRVMVIDPHSEVVRNLIGDSYRGMAMPHAIITSLRSQFYDRVIAPDAGAADRAWNMSHSITNSLEEPVYASKKRDPKTGKLSGFQIESLKPGKYLLVDDICDGGGTFIGLAQEIHKNPDIHLDLWVTHGIFSKGLDELKKHFNTIYTTDSWPQKDDPSLRVFELKWQAQSYFHKTSV